MKEEMTRDFFFNNLIYLPFILQMITPSKKILF